MNDEKIDRYLLDPNAPPADEVVEIEQRLAPLRFSGGSNFQLPRRRSAVGSMLALAASIIIAVAIGAWIFSWPDEKAWRVERGPMAELPVGETVQPDASMLIHVARIGWMQVREGSVLTLLSTDTNRHRLSLDEGTIHVSVWAPPRSVAVRTLTGEVVDFGCEFILRVDKSVTNVEVVSGWVEMENAAGKLLVPGGAYSHMEAEDLPSVPLFKTAPAEFQAAVRELERGNAAAVETVLRTARRRDLLTLLILAQRSRPHRDAILVRAAELHAPQSPATVVRARRGDDEAIQQWIGELPLPPPNAWFRNWRDRLR